MMRTLAATVAVISLFSSVAQIAAQDRSGDPAMDLLVGLLTGFPFGGNDPPEVLVGQLPDRLSALRLPALSRPIGSVVYPTHSFSDVEWDTAGPGLEVWANTLTSAGWTRERSQEQPGFQIGPIRQEVKLCQGDSVSVSMGASAGPHGETRVTVFEVRDRRFTGCGVQIPEAGARPQSPIPPLSPPVGATVWGTGGGGSGRDWNSHIELRAEMEVEPLLRHYAEQLQATGWTMDGPVSLPSASVMSVAFTDVNGGKWYGSVTVSAAPDGTSRNVIIAVARQAQ